MVVAAAVAVFALATGALFVRTASQVFACAIPVFRYALERTFSAEYELVVVHEGDFTPEEKAVLDRLAEAAEDGANIKVIEGKAESIAEDGAAIPEAQPSGGGAQAVLRFPAYLGIRVALWSGPLRSLDPDRLLDSPARREIARRILKGEGAVWVLLESGDRKADDAAGAVLAAELKKLARNGPAPRAGTLELPQLDDVTFDEAEDEAEGEADASGPSVSFSVLRVPRGGPERFLVEMLLLTEPDLRGCSQPMAFPVFARGRVLFTLVGKGINPSNIGQACSFLVGPCACGVQGRMPGVELLMNVDWEGLLSGGAVIDQALPPLTGFPEVEEVPRRREEERGAGLEREDSIPTTLPSSPQTPGVEDSPPAGTVRNVALALGAGAVLVALASAVLVKWGKRARKGGPSQGNHG